MENTHQAYGWASSKASHSSAYLLPQIIKILDGLSVRRVVDLGAGNGALCKQLKTAGYDVVGAEYDSDGVEIAKKAYPEIPFYRLDVTADPTHLLSHEMPFDAIISTEVIEHLFSPQDFVTFADAVMKPGGYFLISTPYHGYLKNLAIVLMGKWDRHHSPLWQGGHIKFWSKNTLSRLLQTGGFTVVGFHGVGRFRYFWKSMILVAVKSKEESS